MFNSHQSEMCASKARQQYTPMGLFFSFTPIKIKLYTMKVSMKSNKFCITSFFENEFYYANELYTNRICPKYTQIGLIFSFTPTTIKLYTMKVYKKSKTFCIRSFFENEFEYANEQFTNRICPKYTLMGLIFCFIPTTIKLYKVKVYRKSNFFCITSFF